MPHGMAKASGNGGAQHEWDKQTDKIIATDTSSYHHHHIFIYLEVVKRNSYKTQA